VTVKSGEFEPGLRDLMITLPQRLTLAAGGRAVKVQSTSGRTLAHQAHFQNHVLTIVLAAAHSPVRVVFGAGSLRAHGGLAGLVSVPRAGCRSGRRPHHAVAHAARRLSALPSARPTGARAAP